MLLLKMTIICSVSTNETIWTIDVLWQKFQNKKCYQNRQNDIPEMKLKSLPTRSFHKSWQDYSQLNLTEFTFQLICPTSLALNRKYIIFCLHTVQRMQATLCKICYVFIIYFGKVFAQYVNIRRNHSLK